MICIFGFKNLNINHTKSGWTTYYNVNDLYLDLTLISNYTYIYLLSSHISFRRLKNAQDTLHFK